MKKFLFITIALLASFPYVAHATLPTTTPSEIHQQLSSWFFLIELVLLIIFSIVAFFPLLKVLKRILSVLSFGIVPIIYILLTSGITFFIISEFFSQPKDLQIFYFLLPLLVVVLEIAAVITIFGRRKKDQERLRTYLVYFLLILAPVIFYLLINDWQIRTVNMRSFDRVEVFDPKNMESVKSQCAGRIWGNADETSKQAQYQKCLQLYPLAR